MRVCRPLCVRSPATTRRTLPAPAFVAIAAALARHDAALVGRPRRKSTECPEKVRVNAEAAERSRRSSAQPTTTSAGPLLHCGTDPSTHGYVRTTVLASE